MSNETIKQTEAPQEPQEPQKKTFLQKMRDFFSHKDSPEVVILRRERGVKRYQLFLLYAATLLLAVYIIFFCVIGITQMPSEDMSPNINAGDVILFYRLERDIKMQDVVVFKKYTYDGDGSAQLFVARVVARPGDTVEIGEAERLIVNGNVILEPKIYESTPARDGYVDYPITLGDDEYFVLVDSRDEGTDSRYFGPVKKDEIIGVIITIIRRNQI